MALFFFGLYSWVTNLLWVFLDCMPAFLRNFFFKLMFARFGRGSMFDYTSYARYPSRIEIGSHTTVNRGCRLYASHGFRNVRIQIGDHVAIAPNVTFYAAGHDYQYYNLPDTAESIIVQDYAWICGGSVIVGGVTIGEGAVVAAGSVVVNNVEPYTVVGGIPARFIKNRDMKEEHPRP